MSLHKKQEPFCCNPKCPHHKYLVYPHQTALHMVSIDPLTSLGVLKGAPPSATTTTHITLPRWRYYRKVEGILLSDVFCDVCHEALVMMGLGEDYDLELSPPGKN